MTSAAANGELKTMGLLLNGVWTQRGHSQKLAKAAVLKLEGMSRARVSPEWA